MTPNELRRKHEKNYPDSHFFDPDTLRFFGERFSEMRVLKDTQIIPDYLGKKHNCYVLSSYQHKAPKGCEKRAYHYFDCETFDYIVS